MAKKETKAVAVKEHSSPPAQATKSKYAGVGHDQIDNDEIYMPRLKLGQSMSPLVKDGIIKEGDLYDSVTGEVICPAGEKIPFIPILHSREFILWDDRKGDDRGMLARATRVIDNGNVRYKWNVPGQTFEVKVDGKTKVKYKLGTYIDEDGLNQWGTQLPGNEDSPPAASEHQNFIIALPSRDYELIAVSMSRTSVGVAKQLNTSLKRSPLAFFERQYEIGSFIDNRGDNKFANYQISPTFKRVEEEVADRMHEVYQGLSGKTIVVDQSNDDEPVSSKGGASANRRF